LSNLFEKPKLKTDPPLRGIFIRICSSQISRIVDERFLPGLQKGCHF
jgi:hypothetical protein